MKQLIKVLLISIMLIVIGCSRVSEEQVINDFNKKFGNNNQIISIQATEGDSDNVYYSIEYIDEKSGKLKEVIFLYQRSMLDDAWVFHE